MNIASNHLPLSLPSQFYKLRHHHHPQSKTFDNFSVRQVALLSQEACLCRQVINSLFLKPYEPG